LVNFTEISSNPQEKYFSLIDPNISTSLLFESCHSGTVLHNVLKEFITLSTTSLVDKLTQVVRKEAVNWDMFLCLCYFLMRYVEESSSLLLATLHDFVKVSVTDTNENLLKGVIFQEVLLICISCAVIVASDMYY
jgi:hypothetical protein